MGEPRRNRRPDGRQQWDDAERRDKNGGRDRPRDRERDRGGDREGDRNRDRRGYRSRSRERRPPRDRSRSAERDRHNNNNNNNNNTRDRDDVRGPGGRDRGNRDWRDERDRRGKQRDDARRRSASPQGQSPPASRHQDASLPTRSRPDKKQPAHMSFNVRNRSPSLPRRRPEAEADDGDGDRRRHRRDDSRDQGTPMDEDEGEVVEVDDEMAAMQAMMGFGGFDSTKGKKVIGNKAGGAHKEKKLEYRQYMNRQGGFNRPLSPTR